MPRRNDSTDEVRVYTYAFYPQEIPAAIDAQWSLSAAMWDAFVAYERTVDERYETLWRMVPDVAMAADQAKAVRDEPDAARDYARLSRVLADLKHRHRVAMGETLRTFWQEIAAERRVIIKSIRQEYAAKGLRYGTYNDVIRRYNQARQQVWAARRQGRHATLRSHDDHDAQALTLQVVRQKGKPPLTWATLTEPSAHPFWQEARMEKPRQADLATRSGRRHRNRHWVMIRLASTPDHDPVWLQGSVALHRVWPSDGVITLIRWVRRPIGIRWGHTLQFTIRSPKSSPVISGSSPTIALGFGEQPAPVGIRVAVWASNGGPDTLVTLDSPTAVQEWRGSQRGELVLPPAFGQAWVHVGDLQRQRRRAFQDARSLLASRPLDLGEMGPLGNTLNPDMITAAVGPTGTAIGLANLVVAWRDHRWNGDEAIYEPLEAWRQEDKRLYEEESHLRSKLLRRRREFYRVFASRIADLYGTIILTSDDVVTDSGLDSPDHRPRRGAPSQLRSIVTWAWNKRHGPPRDIVISPDVVAPCPQGHLCKIPLHGSGQVVCSTCGIGLDIDIDRALAQSLLLAETQDAETLPKPNS